MEMEVEDGGRTPRPEGSRTPRDEPRTPRRQAGREEIPETPSSASSRASRRNQATPAKSVASEPVNTPLKWGARQRGAEDQVGDEIPPSPAHSLAPTSPGTGKILFIYVY